MKRLSILEPRPRNREPNFKAWTIFFDFQNAGRQDATRESITGDDSLTEYCVWIYQGIYTDIYHDRELIFY